MAKKSNIMAGDLVSGWIVVRQSEMTRQGAKFIVRCPDCNFTKEVFGKNLVRAKPHCGHGAQRSTSTLTVLGKTMSVNEWASHINVPASTIYRRLRDREINPFSRYQTDEAVVYGSAAGRMPELDIKQDADKITDMLLHLIQVKVIPKAMAAANRVVAEELYEALNKNASAIIRAYLAGESTETTAPRPLPEPSIPTTVEIEEQIEVLRQRGIPEDDLVVHRQWLLDGCPATKAAPEPVAVVPTEEERRWIAQDAAMRQMALHSSLDEAWQRVQSLKPVFEVPDTDLSEYAEVTPDEVALLQKTPWWGYCNNTLQNQKGIIYGGPNTFDNHVAVSQDDFTFLVRGFHRCKLPRYNSCERWMRLHLYYLPAAITWGAFDAPSYNRLRERYTLLEFLTHANHWHGDGNPESADWMRWALNRCLALGVHPLRHPSLIRVNPYVTEKATDYRSAGRIRLSGVAEKIIHQALVLNYGEDWESEWLSAHYGAPDVPHWYSMLGISAWDLGHKEKELPEAFAQGRVLDMCWEFGRNQAYWEVPEGETIRLKKSWGSFPFEIYNDSASPQDFSVFDDTPVDLGLWLGD